MPTVYSQYSVITINKLVLTADALAVDMVHDMRNIESAYCTQPDLNTYLFYDGIWQFITG